MAKNNVLQASNSKLITEISPQFRLGSATRPHEVGIGSNRGSAGRGEYVLGSCTHRKFNARMAAYITNRLKSYLVAKKIRQVSFGNELTGGSEAKNSHT